MDRIKKLASYLRENGFHNEASYLEENFIYHTASALSAPELAGLTRLMREAPVEQREQGEISGDWDKVIKALDSKGPAFEQVDSIGQTLKSFSDKIIGLIVSIWNWATGGGQQEVKQLQTEEGKTAVRNLESLIKRAEENGESELLKVADQSWWNKFIHGDLSKSTSRAGKSLSMWKAIPILGTFVSLYSLFKNFKEAVMNAKIIISELPLSRYGITPAMIFSGNASAIEAAFDQSIEKLKDTPVAPAGQPSLEELAGIMNVISRFWMDSFKTILNVVYSIIDTSELLVGLLDGPFPFMDAIAQTFGGIMTTGIVVGIELTGESFSDSWWKGQKDKIRSIAQAHSNDQSAVLEGANETQEPPISAV